MKHISRLILAVLLTALPAFAQDEISTSTGIIGNGRLLGAKTYDGQATVGVLGVDSSGNTSIKSLSGKVVNIPGNATVTGTLGVTGVTTFTGSPLPSASNTKDLGSVGTEWRAIYSNILSGGAGQNLDLRAVSGNVDVYTGSAVRTARFLSSGDMSIPVSGTIALQEATAGTKCMGTVTANGTTAVPVTTTCATTGSRIFLTRSSAPSGTAICWQTNIVNATSFDLDCSGAETGTFDWMIVHEAP